MFVLRSTFQMTNYMRSTNNRKMRILQFLGLNVALCSLAFSWPFDWSAKEPEYTDGLEKKGDPPQYANETQAGHELAASSSELGFALYKQVAAGHPSENIAFSPFIIRLALALGYLATKNYNSDQIKEDNGVRTSEVPKTEIHDDIHQPNVKDSEQLLLSDFRNNFNIRNSEAVTVDSQNTDDATKQINSYVENFTNVDISNLLSVVNKDTDSMMVYFYQFTNGLETPFKDKSVEDFHVNKDNTMKVPFLCTADYYNMAVLDQATLVAVPYKGNVSALYILPNEGKMEEVEANLEDIVKKWEEHNQSKLVKLCIPTFSLSGCLNLKEELAKIGMTDVFSTLSGTTGDSNLNISKVFHIAKVNLDEKAQNAAMTTGLEISPLSEPVPVLLDRPFLLIIKEMNDYLLLGKVVIPLDSSNRCPK